MTERIFDFLTSPMFFDHILQIALFVLLVFAAAKLNVLHISTEHIKLGVPVESLDSYVERAIIREQCDFTHTYLMGLVSKIKAVTPDLLYGGYFTKYILEAAYDEFVRWITFNHITDDEAYISSKQKKICALVYSFSEIKSEFKTKEFENRMKNWVEEIIKELVRIRAIYTQQYKK